MMKIKSYQKLIVNKLKIKYIIIYQQLKVYKF